MNELILLGEVVLMFTTLLCFKRAFGKEGLFIWIGIASVLANIQVTKSVEMFGIDATLGNVLFSSVFLATDLLRECYGKKEAKKGVWIGVSSIVLYLAYSQITLSYIPSNIDVSNEAMNTLFALSPRVCVASLIMYTIANIADVHIYDRLHELFNGKKLWFRNNVATILCNCIENFGFMFLAFGGIYSVKDILTIAVGASLIEIAVALCDTPFLYIGRKV